MRVRKGSCGESKLDVRFTAGVARAARFAAALALTAAAAAPAMAGVVGSGGAIYAPGGLALGGRS